MVPGLDGSHALLLCPPLANWVRAELRIAAGTLTVKGRKCEASAEFTFVHVYEQSHNGDLFRIGCSELDIWK